MKATIDFEDGLYRRLKATAALQGRKVKDLVAEAVRSLLSDEKPALRRRKRIQLPVVKSKKPGTLALTSEAIAELETLLDLSDARRSS